MSTSTDSRDRGTWTPESHFAEFWADPDPGSMSDRKHPDVAGYWPGGLVVRGVADYDGQLVRIVQALPGLRLEVIEHATADDLTFIRWLATRPIPDGTRTMEGVDRLRVVDGRITENRIFFDTAEFERFADMTFPPPASESEGSR